MNSLPWIGSGIPTNPSLDGLNRILNQKSLDEILMWAYSYSQGHLIPVTSFGPSGLVILHKMQQLGILNRIISIDTLHLFPETYSFIKSWISRHPNVQVSLYKPNGFESQQTFSTKFGNDLYKTDYERYAYLTKIEPLQRALLNHSPKIWITGRRQSQGGERSSLKVIEYDDNSDRLKLNPLVNWSSDEVWAYIRQHNIPYNSMHDQGFTSIGDVNTTSLPVNKEERSGRFIGLGRTECGCHKKNQAAAAFS